MGRIHIGSVVYHRMKLRHIQAPFGSVHVCCMIPEKDGEMNHNVQHCTIQVHLQSYLYVSSRLETIDD
jgi:hypothetical protein